MSNCKECFVKRFIDGHHIALLPTEACYTPQVINQKPYDIWESPSQKFLDKIVVNLGLIWLAFIQIQWQLTDYRTRLWHIVACLILFKFLS